MSENRKCLHTKHSANLCRQMLICFIAHPVSDLAPGQMGMDDMKMLEQKAQQLAAEAEKDKPKPKEKILFVRFVLLSLRWQSEVSFEFGINVPEKKMKEKKKLYVPIQEWCLSQWTCWALKTSKPWWDRHRRRRGRQWPGPRGWVTTI